jgi:hypothetical protein
MAHKTVTTKNARYLILFVACTVLGLQSCIAHDGWAPKFYPGLEAVGSVEWIQGAFNGRGEAVRLKWESGAMKFGVWKPVTTELSGFVDWTVSAQIKSEGDNWGEALKRVAF